MRELEGLERLDMKQEMVSPGDVRRDRRREVHQAREPGRQRGQLWQRIGSANGPKRVEPDVKAKAPGGRVPMGRQEVVPVLQDEPDAREGGDACPEPVAHAVE